MPPFENPRKAELEKAHPDGAELEEGGNIDARLGDDAPGGGAKAKADAKADAPADKD